MPYKTIWEEKGVQWVYTGILSGDELLQSNMEIYGDPRFDKLRYQIVNFLGVTEFQVSTDTMEEITVMDMGASNTNPMLKVAVVATDTQANRLVELYETTTGGAPWETEIFATEKAARAWITDRFGIQFD